MSASSSTLNAFTNTQNPFSESSTCRNHAKPGRTDLDINLRLVQLRKYDSRLW